MSAALISGPVGTDRWGITAASDQQFRRILIQVAVLWIAFIFAGKLLPVPQSAPAGQSEAVRHYVELLPDAQPVTELPIPQPEPEPKPEPKPKAEPQPEPKPVSKVKPEPKQVSDEARQKAARALAEKSGLMNLRQQLRELRNSETAAMRQPSSLSERHQPTATAPSSGDIVSSVRSASGGSGKLGSRSVSHEQQSTTLAAYQTTQVSQTVSSPSPAATGEEGSAVTADNARSLEEIQLVFDRSKGSFYAIFNRAARMDSRIRSGSVVISLTIAPSGEVTDCELVSSSFQNPQLERKLLQRVKLLKFEARDVPAFTYANYPISYVPS